MTLQIMLMAGSADSYSWLGTQGRLGGAGPALQALSP